MMSGKELTSSGISCVVDGENIAFCSDVGALLSLVDTQDSVSQIVKDICLYHHDRFSYHTDYLTTVLFILYHVKISTLSTLLEQGVPVQYIIQYMREAVDLCIANIDHWSIPVDVQSFSVLDQHDGGHIGSSTTATTFGADASNLGTAPSCSQLLNSARISSMSESNSAGSSPSLESNSAKPISESNSSRKKPCSEPSNPGRISPCSKLSNLTKQSNSEAHCSKTTTKINFERLNEAKNGFSDLDWNSDFREIEFGTSDSACDMPSESPSEIPSFHSINGNEQTVCDSVGCKPVFLKMAAKEQKCIDSDDVLWFFDDFTDPTNGVIQNESRLVNSDNSKLCNGIAENFSECNSAVPSASEPKSQNKDKRPKNDFEIENLQDKSENEELQDEFGIEHLKDKFGNENLKDKFGNENLKDKIGIENSEDEFDSIFTSSEMSSTKNENSQNISSKSLKIDKSFKYFEDLLQKLPGQSSKEHPIKSSNILSRHLKNMDSAEIPVFETREDLTTKTSNKDVGPKVESDTEKRNKINAILENFNSKLSLKTLASNVLNSSRHFKTFSKSEPRNILEENDSFSVEPSSSAQIVRNVPIDPKSGFVTPPNLSSVENTEFSSNSIGTPNSNIIVNTQSSVKSQNSVITQNLVRTQKPVTKQQPVTTQNFMKAQNSTTIQKLVTTQHPLKTQNSTSTQNSVTTPKPVTTQTAMTTQSSVKTQNSLKIQISTHATCEQKLKAKKMSSFPSDSKTKKSLTIEEVCSGFHGDEMVKGIVLESFKSQVNAECSKVVRFDTRRIHAVLDVGPSQHFTRLIPGLVLNCSMDCVVRLKQFDRINALLVNGDLTSSFHHKGYKANYKGVHISKSVAMETREDKWISQLLVVLLKLKVNTVLVKGHTNSKVRDSLEANDIVTLESVPYKILEVLSETTGTIPVIYPLEAFEGNVCKNLRIKEFNDNYLYTRSETTTRCIIQHQQSPLQTVIICHPCQLGAEVLLQEFWKCANQLKDAITDGMVLPGTGVVEEWCGHLLQESAETAYKSLQTSMADKAYFKPLVFEEMGNMFQNLATQRKEKYEAEIHDFDTDVGNECCPKPKYDNYRCKIQTWKKALETMVDILRTDCIITTGADDKDFSLMSSPFSFYTYENKSWI